MSTEGVSSSDAPAGVPFNVTGLASGLDTNEIISELMSIQREPVVHLTDEQTTDNAQKSALESIQSSLRQLSYAASELVSPTLYQTVESVSSSEPSRVGATSTAGAGVGGYQVEVTQLANSAQRTFSFTSPAAEQTLTIDGQPITVSAGESAANLAQAINSDSQATVYAAATSEGTLVFSDRETGETGSEFIQVADAEGVLSEQAGLARQGRDAQYSVDGVEGTSTSNTVKNAIAGVTLSLNALTTTSGPVTIDVNPPALDTSSVVSQVRSFVELYNSTISSIHAQLTTKRPAEARSASELNTGTLFGDTELSGLLDDMRESIYTPMAGLSEAMSSLADIGVSTGAPSGSATYSQTSVEGHLELNTKELEEALASNPEGVQKMLQGWALGFQETLGGEAEPGGMLEARISSDASQSSYLQTQITTMEEMLTIRQEALQAQYAAMEEVISQNKAEGEWLTSESTAASES